jgi:hypothetical protein
VCWREIASVVCEGASPYCRKCSSCEHVGRVFLRGTCTLPREVSAAEREEETKLRAAIERAKPYCLHHGCTVPNPVPFWGCRECGHTWGVQNEDDARGWLKAD